MIFFYHHKVKICAQKPLFNTSFHFKNTRIIHKVTKIVTKTPILGQD